MDLLLETRDYHNQRRKEGDDPVEVIVTDPKGKACGDVVLEDNEDGTYGIKFTPAEAGAYKVKVEIFGRPIKDEFALVQVQEHNNPLRTWGKGDLCQPVSVAKAADGEIFVLDTGNGRIAVLDSGLNFKRVLNNEALEVS